MIVSDNETGEFVQLPINPTLGLTYSLRLREHLYLSSNDFAFRMSAEPKSTTKPIYAALRDAAEVSRQAASETAARAGSAMAAPQAIPETVDAAYWRQHIQRIDTMSEAMWAGFLDAPVNGLPTELADYVATQLSALRLRLRLMGYSSLPARGARVQIAPKTKQP